MRNMLHLLSLVACFSIVPHKRHLGSTNPCTHQRRAVCEYILQVAFEAHLVAFVAVAHPV